ncbi:thioredoxin domain-containing protein [Oceaniglobus ichthyenteri]|uniref:thioredoxin domain-containing protein n=1 Tax=Oceaniglobus ichthyenteri TaxID=2136177 RepID=UPI000D36C51E|nr:thioredoxin domain-containing protein [Oceaniglobus ichthyenteri]
MAINVVCLECGQGNRIPEAKLNAGPKCATCGTALFTDKPTEISLDILTKAARVDTMPLIVDYWAAWCGPCRMMAPEFAAAAKAMKGKARFAKLDTEAYPKASQRYDIRGIPLLIAFVGGREVKRQSGAIPAAKIIEWASGLVQAKGGVK